MTLLSAASVDQSRGQGAALAAFGHVLPALRRWREYRRVLAELAELSARELDDLGLGKADLTRIAREATASA